MKTSRDIASASFEEVVSQAAWVRRFALALVVDPDVAADVTQETLTRAWQHPPQERGPMRPWLATVVRNVVRSRFRSEGRRAVRDQAAQAAGPSSAESAEDQLARWQLFKKIVAAVESLSEPFRQTVMSRYFDGWTAAEIARRDGIPEATVRGRLKTGLDQLRGQLDDQHEGKRRAWVAILVPLLPKKTAVPPPTPAPRVATRSWLLPALACAIVVGLALSWPQLARLVGGYRSGDEHGTQGATASARAGGRPSANPGLAVAVGNGEQGPTPLRSLAACLADVTALREKRRDLEQAMAKTSGPHSLFRAGQPNDIATRALQPVFASLLQDEDGHPVPFELTCRDLACRIEFLVSRSQHAKFTGVSWKAPLLTARASDWETFPTQTMHDSLTRETVTKHTTFIGLRRQDGAAMATSPPPNDDDAWIPLRTPQPLPSDPASCRDEVAQLEASIALDRLALEADKNADDGYAESAPNPALTTEITPILRRMLARALGSSALQVECRGRACQMEVPPAFARQHPDWVRQMRSDVPPQMRPRLAGSHHATGEPVGHILVIPAGFQKGNEWMRQRLEERGGEPSDEEAQAHCRLPKEIRGTVAIELIVTTGLLPHDTGDAGPIRFAQGGSLAGTAAADCMATLFKERLQGVEVPENLWEGSIEFEYEWK